MSEPWPSRPTGLLAPLLLGALDRVGEAPHALGVADRAGRDRVHPDPVGAPLHRAGAGQRVDARLGRGDVRLQRHPLQLERGGDVDDVPAVLAEPRVERGLRHVVGAEEVDVDDGLEPVGRDLRHRGREIAGGVVHEDVELAEPVDDPADDPLHRGRVADVADVEVRLDVLAAQLVRRLLESLCVAAGDGDARAVVAEHPADLLPDSGRAAGDERDRAAQEVRAERGLRQIGHLSEPSLSWRNSIRASLTTAGSSCWIQ